MEKLRRRFKIGHTGSAFPDNRGFFMHQKKFDGSTNHRVFSHAGENRDGEGAMHLGKMLDSGVALPRTRSEVAWNDDQ
jgi:hypothetical protein